MYFNIFFNSTKLKNKNKLHQILNKNNNNII